MLKLADCVHSRLGSRIAKGHAMADSDQPVGATDRRAADRRKLNRRREDVAIAHPDQRKGDRRMATRRSARDRRDSPRD